MQLGARMHTSEVTLVRPDDPEYLQYLARFSNEPRHDMSVDLAVEEVIRRRMFHTGWTLDERRVIRIAGSRVRYFECDAIATFGKLSVVAEVKNSPGRLTIIKATKQLELRRRFLLDAGYPLVEPLLVVVGSKKPWLPRDFGRSGRWRTLRASESQVDAWAGQVGVALPAGWSDLSARFYNLAVGAAPCAS